MSEHQLLELLHLVEGFLDESSGWDQPASLWEVHSPTENTQLTFSLSESALSVELVSLLEESPVDELLGRSASPTALGVMLVTEGWTFGEERDVANRHRMSSDNRNSLEVRVALLVMRNGDEAWLRHIRGSQPEAWITSKGGRNIPEGPAVWSLRRAVGLPSQAEHSSFGALPDVTDVIGTLETAANLEYLLEACELVMKEGFSTTAAREAFSTVIRHPSQSDRPTAEVRTWEEARRHFIEDLTRRRLALAGREEWEAFEACEGSIRIAEWSDAPLFARTTAAQTPTRGELAERLLQAARRKHLPADLVGVVADVLNLESPYGSWGVLTKPGRNEPCPCGSTKRFKHCHGATRLDGSQNRTHHSIEKGAESP